MRYLIPLFTTLLFAASMTGQSVDLLREAELVPGGYSITGLGFLEELDNGDLQLRLSDDFSTPAGPDVRILLSNSLSLSGSEEIVNLSDIGHFNGGLTVPVPSSIGIEDFDFMLFYCVAFQQLWASGEFGEVIIMNDATCEENDVNNANGSNNIDICPADGNSDVVEFENSLGLDAGDEYIYLITDNNQILEEVVMDDDFDFEGSSDDEQRVYGLHYAGDLDIQIGSIRTATTASDCFEHSDNSFIQITKNACPSCEESEVTNIDGNNTIDICSSDNIDDIVEFENNLGLDAGSEYVYLLTDENEILTEVLFEDFYDFEGTDEEEQRIYGLNYSGTLDIDIGSHRTETTASACFEHSSDNDFITITKNACITFDCLNSETYTADATSDTLRVINICPTDGIPDSIVMRNSINAEAGDHYAYIITNTQGITQSISIDSTINFENSGLDTQLVYGIHFDGTLIQNIGQDRLMTTATGCFTHSDNMNFLTVAKDACPPVFECLSSTTNTAGGSMVDICSNDGQSDVVLLNNSLNLSAGAHYAYLITDESNILQEVVLSNFYNFEGSSQSTQRVFGLHYDGTLIPAIGQNRTATTATGCFTHSQSNGFITITKNACVPEFVCFNNTVNSAGASAVDICSNDGQSDVVLLNNSLNLAAGTHYAYLITDESDILQEIVLSNFYNFEGSSQSTQRIFGLHYDGTLIPAVGQIRTATTATGCFTHSQSNGFITVTKNACIPEFECLNNTVNSAGASSIDICSNDGQNDILNLNNSLNVSAGNNYAYLITDSNEILQQVIFSNNINLEGSSQNTQRIYGVHYNGTLTPAIGQIRTATTATDCFIHSNANGFITVTKNACAPTFECRESLTATTDWATSVEVCPTDGIEDIIELRNNLFIEPGDHYAYLITDSNNILQEVTTDPLYNFDGSSLNEQRVYGIHFDGALMPIIGQDRLQTTATGCFIHSGDNLFLTITKVDCSNTFECRESLTATTNWVTEVDICAGDGEADLIELKNNIEAPVGNNYAFLITDEFENLQEVFFDTLYNFENSGNEEQRIYGLSYDGLLSVRIGENRKNTTASNCFIHSGDNLFIRINKSAACNTTSTAEEITLAENIKIFPNPSNGLININTDNITESINSMVLYDINGRMIQEIIDNQVHITNPGVYLLKISNTTVSVTKRIVIQ
jgi:hypothetical protein